MANKKKYLSAIAIGILLISLIGVVVAKEMILESDLEGNPIIIVEPPTLWEKILSFFRINDFTIVGVDRLCSVNADIIFQTVPQGELTPGSGWYCTNINNPPFGENKPYSLWVLYSKSSESANWVAKYELEAMGTETSFVLECDSYQCKYEIYCCPTPVCTSNYDCEGWIGPSSSCDTKVAVDSYAPLMRITSPLFTIPIVLESVTSYKYCTAECIEPDIDCWRINNGVCEKTSYPCNYETYPNCPSSWSYTSLSQCEAAIPDPVDPDPTPDPEPDPINIEVTDITLPSDTDLINKPVSAERKFSVRVKNNGVSTATVYVEAGFYTQDYAKDEAGLFSAFPFFIIKEPVANCVPDEKFVKTTKVVVDPGETTIVEIKQSPLFAYVTLPVGITYSLTDIDLVSFLGVYEKCCQRLPEGGCVEGTGGYIDSKFDATFNNEDIGWLGKDNIVCDAEVYGEVTYNLLDDDTLIINRNWRECIDFVFYNESGDINETITEENKFQFQNIKKIALTRDKISKATSVELLSSACLSSLECVLPTNDSEKYDATCINIAKLREDGVLTESDSDNFFENAKSISTGAAFGAGAGITACIVTATAVSVVIPITTPLIWGCGIAGALLGGVGTDAVLEYIQDDSLLKSLSAENANAVGICVKDPKGIDLDTWFDWAAWFDVDFDGDKDGTDGLIIVLVGGMLLFLLLRRR